MSIVRQNFAGEKEVVLQKKQKRAAKFNLSSWSSELLAPISPRANNKTSCTNEFSQLGKGSCCHILKIRQYRKSRNWNCFTIIS